MVSLSNFLIKFQQNKSLMDRNNLPYRENCEGYFLFESDSVIALDTGKGYIEFPGGGVDDGESPKEAVSREAFEEAGVKVKGVKS